MNKNVVVVVHFFAEAMSYIIAIRKNVSNIILQPLHEIYYDGTSVWTEEKSYTFAVSKNYLHSI